MDSRKLKKNFGAIAQSYGFNYAFGGWYKQSTESIVVFSFQKSNYGDFFYLNIKIYIQYIFKTKYVINRDLIKKDIGDIFLRPLAKYDSAFNLENNIDDEQRMQVMANLFNNFLVPFTNQALSKAGIKRLSDEGLIDIFPAIQKEMDILMKS